MPLVWPKRVVLICGMPCVGKSIAGAFLSQATHYTHFEASRVMYELHAQYADDTESMDEFALRRLAKFPAEVPETIIKTAMLVGDQHIVITGLRSPAEVAALSNVPSLKLIFVISDDEIRYARSSERGRADHANCIEQFKRRDQFQRLMGVEQIPESYKSVFITNNGTLEEYQKQLLENAVD